MLTMDITPPVIPLSYLHRINTESWCMTMPMASSRPGRKMMQEP